MIVDSELAAGLFEDTYEACLRYELQKLADKQLRLLPNVDTPYLKDGIIRIVNSYVPSSRTSRTSRYNFQNKKPPNFVRGSTALGVSGGFFRNKSL